MATSLERTLAVQISGAFDNPLDNTTPTQPIDYIRQMRITNGTSTGQGTQFFEDTRSIASSTSEVLSLSSGLTNAFGTVPTIARITMLWLIASSTNSSVLTVGGATATAFPIFGSTVNSITLRPGAQMLMNYDGSTGYSSTNGNLMVTNSSHGAGSYRIFLDGST